MVSQVLLDLSRLEVVHGARVENDLTDEPAERGAQCVVGAAKKIHRSNLRDGQREVLLRSGRRTVLAEQDTVARTKNAESPCEKFAKPVGKLKYWLAPSSSTDGWCPMPSDLSTGR